MTPDAVKEFFKTHYNLETLLGGQKALAHFICNGFIREKANYICTDRARHKFVIEDETGKHIEDTNCDQLIGLSAPGLHHVSDVYEDALFTKHEADKEEEIHSNYLKITNMDNDRSEFTNEMSKIVPAAVVSKSTLHDQAMAQFKQMRENAMKARIESHESTENSVLNEIGGISLGKLDTYRKAYKKRKDIVGNKAEIKVPRDLMVQFKENPLLEKKYIAFITS